MAYPPFVSLTKVALLHWLIVCNVCRAACIPPHLRGGPENWFSKWGSGTPRGPWGSSRGSPALEPNAPVWVFNSDSTLVQVS